MITVITGAPGAGKTAALVDLLRQVAASGRVCYVHGIPELKIPGVIELEEPARWPELVPDGAAVFISEVQKFWRPRGPGQKPPAEIQAFETHRHRGLDFFFDTQSPALVDKSIRALTGRHVHLRDVGILGRRWYEWTEISESLAWKTAPIRKKYKLPKGIFGQYKSASLHIKPIRTFPMMVVFGGLAVCAFAFLLWRAYGSVSSRINPGSVTASTPAPGASGAGLAVPRAMLIPRTRSEYRKAETPVVPGRPETAPMYDPLRQVVRMPRIQGGYCYAGKCQCYIQGGMRAPITEGQCIEWLKDPPFDPYYSPVQPGQVQPGPNQTSGQAAPPPPPSPA